MSCKYIYLNGDKFPACNADRCFSNMDINGKRACNCLNNNDFGGRPCPFYKSRERFKAERMREWNERTLG